MNQNEHGSATLKEILSQPAVWLECIAQLRKSRLLDEIRGQTQQQTEWIFIGCGTSYYLAEAAALSWTRLAGQPARALPASEVLLFADTLRPNRQMQAVLISRSGQTSEALRAAQLLSQTYFVPTLGITCAANTPLEQLCDRTIQLLPADERSMVMTRSFSSMVLALQSLAACKGGEIQLLDALRRISEQLAGSIAALAQGIEDFVARNRFADYVFLGQGPFFALSREASLKITEMSCSYSQAYHTLEFRHGPKAIVGPETCLTFFLSDAGMQAESEVLSEMNELGGVTIAVCNEASPAVRRASTLVLEMGLPGPELAMLAPFIVPAQLLGFFTAVKKALNPDEPKNLSRVVILD